VVAVSDFRFAEPSWEILLWAVAAFVALMFWLDSRSSDVLSRFVSPVMAQRLAHAPSAGRRRLAIALLGASLASLVVALMRPQWGVQFVATPRVGAEIMVCLDVSNSMLAEDVAPNRLERAKAELRDLLAYLGGDSVGLIAFAGRATVLSPLTPDFSFLRLVLDSTGPQSVARGGTRLEEPIRKAVAGFGASGAASRSIILITDGEDHDSFPLEAAKAAAEKGIKILAIGFGDENGAEIQVTDPKTGAKKPLHDSNGKAVISRLDGGLLRQIALASGGAYVPAGTGVLDLQSIYDRHIAGLTRGEMDGRRRTIRNEAYQWAVLAAIVLLLASLATSARRPSRSASNAVAAASTVLLAALLTTAGTARAAAPATSGQPAPTPPTAQHANTEQRSRTAAQAAGAPASPTEPRADAAAAAVENAGEAGTPATDEAATPDEPAPPPEDKRAPREIYNAGIAALGEGKLDEADQLLTKAREKGAFDGALRGAATYNLGIAEARRADAALQGKPEDALAALERAAAWFREAVAIDAKDQDARYNLELVLKRALVLADSIAKKKQKSLLDDITALMEEQRTFLTGLRESANQTTGGDAGAEEKLRGAARALAARQLELSSKAEDLSERSGREQDAIKDKPADQQSPEDAMHAAQLGGALNYLHLTRERMGQARGRLRRLETDGAYRAASGALTELERARDQLLDPVKVLDVLVADTAELARMTGLKAAIDSGDAQIAAQVPPQKWLTSAYLADSESDMRERVEELHYGFVAAVSQAAAAAANGGGAAGAGTAGNETGAAPESAERAAFLERVRESEPLLGDAVAALADGKNQLDGGHVREALEPQAKALQSLAAARERFLDLQRLIELLYEDQKRIETTITPDDKRSDADLGEYAALARDLERSNVERGARVARALKEETQAAAARQSEAAAAAQQAQAGAAPGAAATGSAPGAASAGGATAQAGDQSAQAAQAAEQAEAEKQRLDLAGTYLVAARGALDNASSRLDEVAHKAESAAPSPPSAEDWAPARAAVSEAATRIEDLRRLFFSVVEHLKELAQRQVELGDKTDAVAALASASPDRDVTDKSGPLGTRQQTLSDTAQPIAKALREQSAQPPPTQQAAGGPQAPDDMPQRLATAADRVDTARSEMDGAVQGFAINPAPFAEVRGHQNAALQALAEAIQLLAPPDQQQQQQDQQQQQQDQQQQGEQQKKDQQQQQGQGAEQQKKEQEEKADPAQLMQGIRDREAQRRADRDKKAAQGYDPVEKDW